MTQSYNVSEDSTASGQGSLTLKAPVDQFVSITSGSEDLHLKSGAACINAGTDLSGTFTDDIDGETRPTGANTWDVGADEDGGDATVIRLSSFTAVGEGRIVHVRWETKTEISNVGFNLYRSTEKEGTYTKLNSSIIPGLISSVTGKKYSFTDAGVSRGTLYYYQLEDIDLKGTKTMHGPVCVDWDGDGIPDDIDPTPGVPDPVAPPSPDPSPDPPVNPETYSVTQITLHEFRARLADEGVQVEWSTDYEVSNLGFHVYREENGEVYRLTPELIAGSALLAGADTPLTAGRQYRWWDTSARADVQGPLTLEDRPSASRNVPQAAGIRG